MTLDCTQFESQLHELLDDRRAWDSDPALAVHARGCGECRALATTLDSLLDAIAEMPRPVPARGLADRVAAKLGSVVLDPVRPASRGVWASWTLQVASSLAAVAAIVLIVWSMSRDRGGVQNAGQHPVGPPPVARPLPAFESHAPQGPALGAIARDATDSYLALARQTSEGLSDVPIPMPNVSLSVQSPVSIVERKQVGDDDTWVRDVADGLEPMTRSTANSLKSLLFALPDAPQDRSS